MNTATKAILAFWEDPRNIPFKNSLISSEPIGDGKEPTTCMCAQGQALYIVGGYSEEDLRNTVQSKADKEVARLLVISVAHSVLLRKINDGQPGAPSDVLTNPEKYLGKNYQSVMKFWWYMDSLTEDNWKEVSRRYIASDHAAKVAASYAIAAKVAASDAASDAAWGAAGNAAYELMGGIENPVFVPLFEGFMAG